MLGLDFHLISIFCLHRALYKIQRWKKVLGKKKKQTPRRKKGYHSVKKRKHSFVKVTGTSGAPRLRPDFDQSSRRQTKICFTWWSLLCRPPQRSTERSRKKKVSAMGYFSREIFIHRQWRSEVPLFYWFAVSRGIIYTTNQNIEKARHLFVDWCFVN